MPKRAPLSERLWRRTLKSDGCWIWQGCKTKQGYGYLGQSGSKNISAHRAAWLVTHKVLPSWLHVLHKCDNPSCVNPEHLFLGTNADNVADREAKGRQLYRKLGAANGRARLTEDQVRCIYDDPRKQDDIAAAYGVSQSTVHRIKARAKGGWNHIPLEPRRSFHRGINRRNYSSPDEYRAAKAQARKKEQKAA